MNRDDVLFFVGSYCIPGPYFHADGEGITACRLNLATGAITRQTVHPEKMNASYLAWGPDPMVMFVADDCYLESGKVVALQHDGTGNLTQRGPAQLTQGTANCHVALTSKGDRLFAAGYLNGTLSAHEVSGGHIAPASVVYRYTGSGPNPARQEAAHAHQAAISPDGRWLYVCDLGSDRVWIHDLRKLSSDTTALPSFTVEPAGAGPRHLVFHPREPLLYILCELDGALLTCRWEAATGALSQLDRQLTLPSDFKGEPAAAAIKFHPGGQALYVSNRNHNSVGVYQLARDGRPVFQARIPCGGNSPRDIECDPSGRWLLVANQESGTILPVAVDPSTGLPTGRTGPVFACGCPCCILFEP